jgi:pantetheine-phosphate adenylyltransferase
MPVEAKRAAVYAGSFDPITLGHLNVIERASRLVDTLYVGIGENAGKQPLFTPAEREQLVRQATAHVPNVAIRGFAGLTVDFVKQLGARVMIRGIRPLGDIEAEFTMTMANRQLDDSIETVFLMSDAEFSHVSSSLIKQIAPLADDASLARFVPQVVIEPLRRKMSQPR